MSNRTFEMYPYRQILVRLRQGDTDRPNGARSRITGRRKIASVRRGRWLKAGWRSSMFTRFNSYPHRSRRP